MIKYREDIDGIRAYAVIAVIIFHLGFLPNGYLGVDIFFVISGFLITSIIYKDLHIGNFSILKFYERRIRRIIPLLIFITSVALVIGLILMLPDDLENLAQSAVASNFSANNILMLITSSDYWATKNEYKPLMHTWSLGVEEQFYLLYPFLLLIVSKIRLRLVVHFLIVTSFLSLLLFLFYGNPSSKFYLLQYRFFELSVGGLFAVFFYKRTISNTVSKYLFILSALVLLSCLIIPIFNNTLLVILTTFFSVVLLTTGGHIEENDFVVRGFFKNKLISYIGKISFSLYLWHQLVFAFSRYAIFEEIDIKAAIILVLLTFVLSILTYHFIENPFRNNKFLSTKKVLAIIGVVFILSSSSAMYIYVIGGVYKDFPSVGIFKSDIKGKKKNFFSANNNLHIAYNEKIRQFDRDFENDSTRKVLVIGNSFGRDVANIVLEHELSSSVNLSYFDINRIKNDQSIIERWNRADVIIISAKGFISKKSILDIGERFNFPINLDKVFMFGTKDFGYSNGIHYNRIDSIDDFSMYFAKMKDGILEVDRKLHAEWENKYISLLSPILNKNNKVRIFDDEGKFISQDTVHLTKAGASFYAKILSSFLENFVFSEQKI